MPVTGRVAVTTAILMMVSMATSEVIPMAIRLPIISGAFIEIRTPRHMSRRKRTITVKAPTKPSSSATIEKIKSFWGSGMYRYF